MIEYVLILLLIAFVLLIFLKTRKQEKERQEQEAYKKIDTLGGTEHIKQQLKTKSAEEIAKKHNLTLESLNRYCQEHDTTIDKLINEIQRDFAAERERLHKEQERQRQQQEHERKIQEAYKKIDTQGGTEHIKQQLKTKSAEEIAQIVNITTENLNQYCQKKGTSINQLKNEIEHERKIQEAYKKIDTQGGTEHIKQQLKTKSADKIAKEYDITSSQLNNYCQKHGTSINQLQIEIEQERKILEAYEKIDTLGGTTYIKQQLKTKSADKIAKEYDITSSQLNNYCQKHNTTIDKLLKENKKEKEEEAYRKINKFGGTEHIKHQLKTKSADEIAKRYNITASQLNKYCQKHNTTIDKLLKENKKEKVEEAYKKIDTLGGTEHIKQQLKTKSAKRIAKRYNITASQLNKYCQKHNTTIDKLLKENKKEEEEAYRKINKFGGTEHIKQQLKTKSAKRIAKEYDITASQLNKYCQKHNTTIDKLRKENKKEKVEEAYKKIDTLGGTEHIKQQLKTKSAKRIAEKYDITASQLNKYCQKHGTTIYQLKDKLIKENGRLNKVNNYSYIKERLKKDKKQYSGDNYNKDLFS